MIGAIRDARRFEASDDATRRRVTRARLCALLVEARARSRFYARDRRTIEALLDAPDDEAFFSAFRALHPLERRDLAESLARITTDREIDRASVEAFARTAEGATDAMRTARGDHRVFETDYAPGAPIRVVDRAASIARTRAVVLHRTLFSPLARARALLALVPVLHALVRPRRGTSAFTPTLRDHVARWLVPSIVVIGAKGAHRSFHPLARGAGPRTHRLALEDEDALDRLAWLAPRVLVGAPGHLAHVVDACARGRVRLAPSVVSVIGVLDAPQRDAIARTMPGARLVESLGAEGSRPIATTCATCGALHLHEDLAYVELLSREDAPVGEGEIAAKVRYTDLHNVTTPLIRLELGLRLERLPDVGCRARTMRVRVHPQVASAPERKRGTLELAARGDGPERALPAVRRVAGGSA